MDSQSGRVFCRKCLLSEIDRNGVYKTVLEYIDSIDPALKCTDEDYSRRLDICRTCEHLNEGMCALCGCFVEVRAVKKKQNCPDIPHRWE